MEVRLDGFVLFVKLGEVGNDVFYNIGVGQRIDFAFGFGVSWDAAQACKSINTVDIHGTTATNSLPTTPSESQGRINLILNPNQSIQHHWSRLVQIKRIRLHAWLLAWFIGVPSIDMKGFDFGICVVGWFFDGGGLRGRSYALSRGAAN